ncbi:SPOR domain-containing protein [Paenibacillus sp. GCM10027626]|uniref:SPOR domain-containing protein n=1 Tax=Paenibacillus sp. GCM10027626 TaxID=3273411 RepID=UPI003630B449
MNSKSRITYRFDRKDGTRVEQQPSAAASSNVVPFFQEELKFSSDVGTWKSPFQDDAFALEKLIRESEQPVSPARAASEMMESHDVEATAVDPASQLPILDEHKRADEELVEELAEEQAAADLFGERNGPIIEEGVDDTRYEVRSHGFKVNTSYRSSRGPSWYKVFASVAGAVATGALFGYLLLGLFMNGDATNNDALPAASGLTDTASNESGKSAAPAAKNATSESKQPLLNVALPAASYYMIQYGVFSNREGMEEATAELRGQGWAAAEMVTGDDFRVYAGISKQRENALLLSGKLVDKDLYVKEVGVPALTKILFHGEAATVQAFFAKTEDLIQTLDNFTLEKLGLGMQSGAGWKDAHQQWTRSLPEMETGVQDEAGKAALRKIAQALNNAAVAAGEYERKASDSHLWAIQTAIMETVMLQKSWFASIDAL